MELKHGYYHLIAILTVAIWGLTFISTKVLINHGLTPQEIFFYRFLIAYLGIWVISPKRLFTNNWQDELWLVAGGIFGGSLYFFTENTALGITQASNVSFIICTAPLLTTILSLLFYKSEKASKGHALILPKQHYSDICELDEDVAAKVLPLAAKIGTAMKKTLNCAGFNVVQNNGVEAGQTVFHFHVHIIPRYEKGPVMVSWVPGEVSPEELTETGAAIRSTL